PFLEAQQLLVELHLLERRQEAAGLEVDERGRDEQELGRYVEVEALHPPELGEILVDDPRQRDLPQVDLLLEDQVEEQVEGALEDGRRRLVRHALPLSPSQAPALRGGRQSRRCRVQRTQGVRARRAMLEAATRAAGSLRLHAARFLRDPADRR